MGLKHLLSDHVPIYFDYADDKSKSNYRVLFANTGSLIGQRGITDNKQHFGDITLRNLEEWSKQLVKPLLKGMVTLIEDSKNKTVLEAAKTWPAFEEALKEAKALVLSKETDTTKLYAVLKTLSTTKWFPVESKKKSMKEKAKEAPGLAGPTVVETFELESKRKIGGNRYTHWKTAPWKVCSDHTIRSPGFEADIVQSFKSMYLNTITCDRPAVEVTLRNRKKDKIKYYFSVNPKLEEFLIHIRDTCTKLDKLSLECKGLCLKGKGLKHFKIRSGIEKVLAEIKKIEQMQPKRRRMAQREFSNRRDSPVMVRLLEE